MKKEFLFDKLSELKDKFKGFFQHRKKIAALENYSSAGKFYHKNYLSLVKECMNEGFLEEQESSFLDHMLQRYELNYLDWAHRTKWLKNEIKQKQAQQKPRIIQEFFNFDRKDTPVNVPISVLMAKTSQSVKRI